MLFLMWAITWIFKQHKLDTDNILDRKSRWFQRGVREVLQIHSRSPPLNWYRGQHQLPPSTTHLSGLVMQVRLLPCHVTTFRAEEKWRMPFESFSLSNFISVSNMFQFIASLLLMLLVRNKEILFVPVFLMCLQVGPIIKVNGTFKWNALKGKKYRYPPKYIRIWPSPPPTNPFCSR